jgi:hypothetical protein
MASEAPPQPASTIVARKTVFLKNAINKLETPFFLSDELLKQSEISPSVLDVVMQEVNRRSRRHNNSVYDMLAVRTVAEQIDALYWEAGEPEKNADDSSDSDSDFEYPDLDVFVEGGYNRADVDGTNPKYGSYSLYYCISLLMNKDI